MLLSMIQMAMMAGTILWHTVRIIKMRKCRKTENPCRNMRCVWRNSCGSYDNRREIVYERVTYLHDRMLYEKHNDNR